MEFQKLKKIIFRPTTHTRETGSGKGKQKYFLRLASACFKHMQNALSMLRISIFASVLGFNYCIPSKKGSAHLGFPVNSVLTRNSCK